jgi:hypothetical protein
MERRCSARMHRCSSVLVQPVPAALVYLMYSMMRKITSTDTWWAWSMCDTAPAPRPEQSTVYTSRSFLHFVHSVCRLS